MDNSLRFSGEGSTLSGEYMIASLWHGEQGEDASHGYRMHQVFFNAVHQYKLGFQPGAWRDDDGPQRFDSRKDYYLGYGRWRPRDETREIGLPGANALYKRMLSNHLRMNILIHHDEFRRTGRLYPDSAFTQYLLNDLPYWRSILAWADPDWAQADAAAVAEFRGAITSPLTAADLADTDEDSRVALLERALGSAPEAADAHDHRLRTTRDPVTGALALTFYRALAEPVTYIVEVSSDLATWTVVETNPGVVAQDVTVADPVPESTPRRFLRLRVIK